jgi:hypothetical protein
MTKTVDEIIQQQQTTPNEKLDVIIENTKPQKEIDDDTDSSETDKAVGSDADDDESSDSEPKVKSKQSPKETPDKSDGEDDGDTEDKKSTAQTKTDDDQAAKSDDTGEKDAGRDTDDYGNPLKKTVEPPIDDTDENAKIYTKADLNRYIRERIERMKIPEGDRQQMTDRVAESVENFKGNKDAEGDWLTQLKTVIREEINEEKNAYVRQQQEIEQQQRYEEDMREQQQFEARFTKGMRQIGIEDFQAVAGKLPLSDSMMLAIRTFKDPAGFVYAAAKSRAAEIAEIKQIRDPLKQATALGRLEESLKREAKKTSKAPNPIQRKKGDMNKHERPRASPDDLIQLDNERITGRR